MNNTINGAGTNSLTQLFQQLGIGGAGGNDNDGDEQGGLNFPIPGQAGAGANPLAALMGGGNDHDGDEGAGGGIANLLSGLNNINSALLSAMMPQAGQAAGASNVTQPTQANPVATAMQGLLDAMFNKASNGTGQMDQTQFTNLIKQMDPNGTSGVDPAKLFSQLDTNNTGFVTQAQFDAAFNGTAGANANDAQAIKSAAGKLMDSMFNNADTNGIFQLNITQFSNLVNQMDPNGTSGVNAGKLFEQLDPNQTGYVSKTQFDSAINGMLNPPASAAPSAQGNSTGTGNTINGAFSQLSVQISIMQYQSTTNLFSGSGMGVGANNGVNSLLNITA